MSNPDKKISFGFSKFTKKINAFVKPPVELKKLELIDCLEGQSIKIKDKIEVIKEPLIIPIAAESSKNIVDRIKNACLKNENLKNKINKEMPEKAASEMTLDELAAQELLKDALNRQKQTYVPKVFALPIGEDKLILDGKEEATLDDYENVPISDYGMAMLRGMGWKEEVGIGKNPKTTTKVEIPDLRPRGMGLGANKMLSKEIPPNQPTTDKDGKELALVKGAYAKIIAGQQKGFYCQVQSLDDESGRIFVKTAINSTVLAVNEFRLLLVTKEDYDRNCLVINSEKYTEYKEKESNEKCVRPRSRSVSYDRTTIKKSSSPAEDKRCGDYSYRQKITNESGSSDDRNQRKASKRYEDVGRSRRKEHDDSSSDEKRLRSRKKRNSSNDSSSTDDRRRNKKECKSSSSKKEPGSSDSDGKHSRDQSRSRKEKKHKKKHRKEKKKDKKRDRSCERSLSKNDRHRR